MTQNTFPIIKRLDQRLVVLLINFIKLYIILFLLFNLQSMYIKILHANSFQKLDIIEITQTGSFVI